MLDNLLIKNIALIDEAYIEFGNGLNILTGETGAGKSMIIDAVNFVLGERIQKDVIRKGQEKAQVDALFRVSEPMVLAALAELGVDVEEDGSILITRMIQSSGKTVCRINGSMATVGMLKQVSEHLIDIHGQHEHQSLLNPARHIELLDKFCGEELVSAKAVLQANYRLYRSVLKQIQAYSGDEGTREQRMDMLQFQISEIESVNLHSGEDEELNERRKVLQNTEKLSEYLTEVLELLYESEEAEAAIDMISKSAGLLQEVAAVDKSLEVCLATIETIVAELDDVTRDIRKYYESIETDPKELYRIEKRLDKIYVLKRKYGPTIDDILEHYEKSVKQLEFINNSEAELNKLALSKSELIAKIKLNCADITQIRRKHAEAIQAKIEEILDELGMKHARFEIEIREKNEFNGNGRDAVEFLISPNPGEPLKPLAKIASGGEMSRCMLALKTVLADSDSIETFIFDEIDTGVSGRTAQKVAEKLVLIGKKNQILCITHLPQIAAMADNHYLIEKNLETEKTTTNVYTLDNDAVVEELARLLGGAEITAATLQAAREMKQLADELKK